jgi:hypothetical protein
MKLYWARWNQRAIKEHSNRIHKLDCSCDNGFLDSGVSSRGSNKLKELNKKVNEMLRGIGVKYNPHQGKWKTQNIGK